MFLNVGPEQLKGTRFSQGHVSFLSSLLLEHCVFVVQLVSLALFSFVEGGRPKTACFLVQADTVWIVKCSFQLQD